MKTILSRLTGVATCVMLLVATHTAIAQAPQKMSYQAVIRTSVNGSHSIPGDQLC